MFVRPVATFGRFGRRVIETDFVQGTIVGGATGVVRVGTSFARAIQTGYLRAYAFLLLLGVAGLTLYFLVTAVTIHCRSSSSCRSPRPDRRVPARAHVALGGAGRHARGARLRVAMLVDFDRVAAGSST